MVINLSLSVHYTLVTLHTTKLSFYAGSYTVKLAGSSLFSLSILRAQVFTQFACFVSLSLSLSICPFCFVNFNVLSFPSSFYFLYLPLFPLVFSIVFHVAISCVYFYVCCCLFYFYSHLYHSFIV